MHIGLQTRLIASLLGVFCLTLLPMGYVLLDDAHNQQEVALAAETTIVARTLAGLSGEALEQADIQRLWSWMDLLVSEEKFVYAALVETSGKVLAHSSHYLVGRDGALHAGGGSAADQSRTLEHKVREIVQPVLVNGVHVADVYVGYHQDGVWQIMEHSVLRIIGVLLLSLAAISGGSFYFTRKLIQPIRYLTGVVSNVSYERHITMEKHVVNRNDEVGVLARTFTDMAARLFDVNQRLREKNHELELRVDERTHKLVAANRELKEAQQRIHAIVDQIAEGVITADADDRIISCNCAAEQIFQHPQEQLIGRTFFSLLEDSVCQPQKLVSGTGAHELVGLRREGERFPVEVALNTIYIASHCTHIFVIRDISEHKRLIDNLEHLADHDAATGLYNRHHFEQEIDHLVERARRGAQDQCALLRLDLDNYRQLQDSHGGVAAQMLGELAALLKLRTRRSDELCHLEGNEFVLLLYGITPQQAKQVASDFKNCVLDYSHQHAGDRLAFSCSIGIAMIGKTSASAEQVLTFADYACYKARQAGSNRIHLFYYDGDSTASPPAARLRDIRA